LRIALSAEESREQPNFDFVETIRIPAVTRYLFELTVGLKLLQMDHRCGLVYYRELLKATTGLLHAAPQ